MLKNLQLRIQQYVTQELPEVQSEFRKGRGIRDSIANILWIREWEENSRKKSTSASLTTLEPLTIWITTSCEKFWKRREYQTTLLPPKKSVCRLRSKSRCFSGILFFYNKMDVGNLISGSFVFSKSSLNIWKISVHVLLNPCLENFQHYFSRVWDQCNCAVIRTFFGIAFFRDWNENWPFPVLWPLLSFPNLLAYWVQHFHSIIF